MNKKRIDKKIILFSLIGYAILLFLVQLQYPMGKIFEEPIRYMIPKFIFENGRLPTAWDASVYDHGYAITYAIRANGSFIVEAFFMKIFSLLGVGTASLYLVARGVNIMFGCIFVYLLFKIADELFATKNRKYVFVSIIALWNWIAYAFQFVCFEGLMLVGVALVTLFVIRGINNKWDYMNCIGLGVANGIILISYLDGIGYCLVSAVAFLSTYIICVKEKNKYVDMIKKGLLIVIETFIISGWFYIRNVVLYGEIMGKQYPLKEWITDKTPTAERQSTLAKAQMFNLKGFFVWIKGQIISYCGKSVNVHSRVFSILFIMLSLIIIIMFVLGLIKVFKQEWKQYKNGKKIFTICMIIGIISTIALDWYYSAFRDYIPNFGRYLLPMTISFVYFLVKGLEYFEEKTKVKIISKGWPLIIVFMLGIYLTTYCYLCKIK